MRNRKKKQDAGNEQMEKFIYLGKRFYNDDTNFIMIVTSGEIRYDENGKIKSKCYNLDMQYPYPTASQKSFSFTEKEFKKLIKAKWLIPMWQDMNGDWHIFNQKKGNEKDIYYLYEHSMRRYLLEN